jgi:hypothetical protein
VLQVEILENGSTLKAETSNLSSSGALLITPRPFPLGTTLNFQLVMPGQFLALPRDVLVVCTGRVVRCIAEAHVFQTAVTLDDYLFFSEETHDSSKA